MCKSSFVGNRRTETADTSWAQTPSYVGMHSDSCYHNIVFQSYPFSFIQAWMLLLCSELTVKPNKVIESSWKNCLNTPDKPETGTEEKA